MLEAVPRFARTGPMVDAGILQAHVLPLIDGLHLDIPRQWQMLKVLPNGEGQRRLTSHPPISVLAILERQLANLFGQALCPPPVQVDKVHASIEGGFDAPIGDGVAVLVLLVQALGLALDGDGGNGRAVVIWSVQHVPGHLDNVALHDGIAVDPHGLLDVGKEQIHYESDVVRQIAVEVYVLPLRLVAGVGVDELVQLVLVLELGDGVEPDVGHVLEGLVADEVEDDVTGRVGPDAPNRCLGPYHCLGVGRVDHVDWFFVVVAAVVVVVPFLGGSAFCGRKTTEGTGGSRSDNVPVVLGSAVF
mmetsp:Transcript_31489/g.92353  ORF Transcript_31489/g.92353 Transcript_31489/m.92353 type:complete len:303 (-) Transcript_31489:171-1079(-)